MLIYEVVLVLRKQLTAIFSLPPSGQPSGDDSFKVCRQDAVSFLLCLTQIFTCFASFFCGCVCRHFLTTTGNGLDEIQLHYYYAKRSGPVCAEGACNAGGGCAITFSILSDLQATVLRVRQQLEESAREVVYIWILFSLFDSS